MQPGIRTVGSTQGLQAVNTMEFVVRVLRGWRESSREAASLQGTAESPVRSNKVINSESLKTRLAPALPCKRRGAFSLYQSSSRHLECLPFVAFAAVVEIRIAEGAAFVVAGQTALRA